MADVQFFFGQALARDAVVVVAKGKQHLAVCHALESGGEILQRRAVEVAHVQTARDRRRRRIDCVGRVRIPLGIALVGVNLLVDPAILPARFDCLGS